MGIFSVEELIVIQASDDCMCYCRCRMSGTRIRGTLEKPPCPYTAAYTELKNKTCFAMQYSEVNNLVKMGHLPSMSETLLDRHLQRAQTVGSPAFVSFQAYPGDRLASAALAADTARRRRQQRTSGSNNDNKNNNLSSSATAASYRATTNPILGVSRLVRRLRNSSSSRKNVTYYYPSPPVQPPPPQTMLPPTPPSPSRYLQQVKHQLDTNEDWHGFIGDGKSSICALHSLESM